MAQPELIAVHHVSLIVADTSKSLDFYVGLFGLQQVERPQMAFNGAWLQLGQQQIHLLELDNPDAVCNRPQHGGRDRHVALTVRQLQPVKTVLQQAGMSYTLSQSGRAALFCRDPDGNAVEFIEAG